VSRQARKALIIGRFLDWELELEQIEFEPFHGKRGWAKKEMVADDFMARLHELDEEWARRVEAAQAAGKVLRYVARLTRTTVILPEHAGQLKRPKERGTAVIGLREVGAGQPPAALLSSFSTDAVSSWPPDGMLRTTDPQSPLGQLAGTDNVILIESNLFKTGQELLLHGPGAGLARTVAAVKADLYLCAMEMPRHHVIGASHLF